MLALAALLQQQEKEIKKTQDEIELLREILASYEENIDTKISELLREQVLTKKKFSQQKNELAEAPTKIEESRKKLAESQTETREMVKALEDAGVKPTPEDIRKALENIDKAKALMAVLKNRAPEEVIKDLEKTAEDKKRLEDEVARLGRKLKGNGGAGEIGSCWISAEDKSTEYVYDVALTDNGIIMRETDIECRKKERTDKHFRDVIFSEGALEILCHSVKV